MDYFCDVGNFLSMKIRFVNYKNNALTFVNCKIYALTFKYPHYESKECSNNIMLIGH